MNTLKTNLSVTLKTNIVILNATPIARPIANLILNVIMCRYNLPCSYQTYTNILICYVTHVHFYVKSTACLYIYFIILDNVFVT